MNKKPIDANNGPDQRRLDQLKTRVASNRNRHFADLIPNLLKSYRLLADLSDVYMRRKGYENFRTGWMTVLYHIDVSQGALPSEIADKALVKRQAVTNLLRELEESDIVLLQKEKKDKRYFRIFYTNEGLKLMNDWHDSLKFIETQILYKIFDEKGNREVSTCFDLLQKIVDRKELFLKTGS
jgi:DNA-binding MarR family transcriptional regulator